MGRIHPAVSKPRVLIEDNNNHSSSIWTVWKKSSMAIQGTDGFSVYDSQGRLAFRVDNYSRRHKNLVLMDGDGKPLYILKPEFFSISDQWNGFKATDEEFSETRMIKSDQMFSVRRKSIFHHQDNEVEIFIGGSSGNNMPKFKIEGCFWRRHCKIRSQSGDVVARISRKKATNAIVLSEDVFSLEIMPGMDCELVMAFIVIMDRICKKTHTQLD